MLRLHRPSRPRLGKLSHALDKALAPILAQAAAPALAPLIHQLEPRCLMTVVTASSADAFVDSIGVNSHFGYNNSSDTTDVYENAALLDTLGGTGIRHIRDYFGSDTDTSGNPFNDRAEYLFDHYGIKVDVVTGAGSPKPMDDILGQLDQPWAESVEGLNEPDNDIWTPPGDTQNPQTFGGTRNWQQTLWDTVNADPSLSNIQVLSSAMGDTSMSGMLNDSTFDAAAIHEYIPGTPGSYLIQSKYLPAAATMMPTPGMPVITTEEGYSTANYADDSQHRPIALNAQRDYIPRVLTENFSAGIDRTYIYELAEDHSDQTNIENGYGLLDHSGNDKPAMTALRNMISLLQEGSLNPTTHEWSSPSFTPGSLDYTLGGNTNNVHQLLLQKSTGEFYLALWQDTPNTSAGNYVDTPAQTVTVNLNKAASSAALYSLDSATTPIATFADAGSISFSVDSQVVILKINPTGYAAPTNVAFTADFTSGGTSGWTPGTGDTWVVNTVAGNNFVQNTNASGSHTLSKPLGATASSLVLDFDSAWQFGGNTSVPYGNYSLSSGVDLLNSSNNGYRILLSQGNSNNAANNNQITRIYKVTAGVASSTPLATGPGYNKAGSSTPNFSHVRVERDATSGAISVYEDIDGDGEYTIVARAVDTSYSSFSKLDLVVGNVNTSEGARFDNITAAVPTVTVATTDATAAESGANYGYFVFTRTGPTTSPLTLTYSLGGSADPSADASLSPIGTITIPAGSASATLTVAPVNDGVVEGDEKLSVRLLESSAYHVGQARTGEVRIIDDAPDLVVTSLTWSPTTVTAGSSVVFKITVQNNGTTTAPSGIPVSIRFNNAGGASVTGSTATTLAPGAWTTVTLPAYTVSGTSRVVRAAVDSGDTSETGSVPESNGANNVLWTFLPVTNATASDNFNSGTPGSPPPGWTPTGDGWQVKTDASQTFLENHTTGTGTRSITKALPSASTKSWILDYNYTWRWGGSSTGNGSSSLGSFVDIVNSSGTGYRIRFLQGNGDNSANNSLLTRIYVMTSGVQGAQLASGTGFNRRGWKSASLAAPDWRAVRIVFDRDKSRLVVLGDLAGNGHYSQLASASSLTPPTNFTQFSLGADNLINTVDPEWDDVNFELIT